MYLGSNAMRAMSNSLSLASMVLRFDIVELWCENEEGGFSCVYVHAADEDLAQNKQIIIGYYPEHKREHVVSPKLCALCKESSGKCHWRTTERDDQELYNIFGFPVLTEMCYTVEGKEGEDPNSGPRVYIIGFASERIEKRESKLKFLSGLGYAISVAVYDFEDESDEESDVVTNELDVKKFAPARALVATPMASSANIPALNTSTVATGTGAGTGNASISVQEFSLGIWGKNMSDVNLAGMQSALQSAAHSPRSSRAISMASMDSGDVGLDLNSSQRHSPRFSPRAPPTRAAMILSSEDDYDNTNAISIDEQQRVISDGMPPLPPPLHVENLHCSNEKLVDNVYPMMATSPSTFTSAESRSQTTPLSLPLLEFSKLNLHSVERTLLPLKEASQHQQQQHQQHDSGEHDRDDSSRDGADTARSGVTLPSLGLPANVAPTWDPSTPFQFPVVEISAKHILPNDLTIDSFADIKHIADGSNANIFLAKLKGEKVIIKMIKASVQNDPVSVHEFDVEHGLLCRISHPNIIRILGAGLFPRRFIVLEYLGGGTLNTILSQNQVKPGLASRLFRKPTFTYTNLLLKARDMADAFDHIHRKVHPGACILHRDLKPDNVGFTSDGVLKIFDFGLATCVRTRTSETECYDMTGFTGSLRYMAPESALRKAYTEKVDVHSFGILVWQMARDKVPFKGLSKDEFLRNVSAGGDRPKLDSSWPPAFSILLTRCWNSDPLQRPSFAMIVEELDRLIHNELPARSPVKGASTGTTKVMRGVLIRATTGFGSPAQSTWF